MKACFTHMRTCALTHPHKYTQISPLPHAKKDPHQMVSKIGVFELEEALWTACS